MKTGWVGMGRREGAISDLHLFPLRPYPIFEGGRERRRGDFGTGRLKKAIFTYTISLNGPFYPSRTDNGENFFMAELITTYDGRK